MVEVNPLVLTGDGRILALDAKVSFDDSALYRHPELRELRDLAEEDPLEVEASKFGLNYIKLDGNIACMVNGAGLAMGTMDIIKHHGGSPANFLDVGGGATQEMVTNAFRILLADPQREGGSRQHLRRHHALRRRRRGDGRRGQERRREGAGRRSPRRDQRRERARDPEGLGPARFSLAEGMRDAAEKVVAAAGGR